MAIYLLKKLPLKHADLSFVYNSRSMEPTISYGSKVLWQSIEIKSIKRGDLVVYLPRGDSSLNSKEAYISRVVAIPGDKLAIGNEFVIINGILYKGGDMGKVKNYPIPGHEFSGNVVISGEIKELGHGKFYVISDNWSNSVDSRILGEISAQHIIGKVISINTK
jgi:signal peptidase I